MENSKFCPTCGKLQIYRNKYKLKRAIELNTDCKKCSGLKRESSEDFRKRCGEAISKTWSNPTPKRKRWLEDKSVRNSNGRIPFSKLEMSIGDVLRPLGFTHGIKTKRIAGFCPDWVNENSKTIVEVFGSFWHADPQKFSSEWTNPKNGWKAEDIWKRDSERIASLEAHGYKVIVVWESEIKRSVLKDTVKLAHCIKQRLRSV